ncbi:SagB-type dehydrogenase domain-containing protein [Streptoalloteichus tenebrarius]|uniref:SagB-type dehydrogenase domain-containing protein n=1 Tax=Streptoalloteichus tenebrarius (strain ATCC 17920 / DSM 40477 / JCM 4838 / CBS 697.72 / NBRC 16177 / NCIMB 11028 / NRRL B-12390 / A12253. 1 / ISP 5477) TaxID=1933 RepID=A0ABT1HPG2_STRSD|nr:SagB/ThcOx family dehydrogenase [Streptoalloteichus tenebrarius]MCP2257404.1 SagB-type dehydrogenase domain-containing protein [Streptoalloteichus tenebrarius]BFE98351.1 hypothetical protein GCM10020241_00270 [Streptoalloteichus tenebrarius]
MTTKYQRNPWLYPEWAADGRLAVTDARDGRTFAVTPAVMELLGRLARPLPASALANGSATRAAELLDRMAAAGLVHVTNGTEDQRNTEDTGEPEDPAGTWTACELALHTQVARRGGPLTSVRLKDIPPARLTHPEASEVISLGEDTREEEAGGPLPEVLRARRSIRDYLDRPLSRQQLATFLHRAARVRARLAPERIQITRRPSPSGGARHSIELYVVARDVSGLAPGAYHYDPFDHRLERLAAWSGELAELQRKLITVATLVDRPPQVSLYLASCFRRTRCKYRASALYTIYCDVGCLLQTMYLVATDLGLAPCATAVLESPISPSFLRPHANDLIHVGNFALGIPDPDEPTSPQVLPLDRTKEQA